MPESCLPHGIELLGGSVRHLVSDLPRSNFGWLSMRAVLQHVLAEFELGDGQADRDGPILSSIVSLQDRYLIHADERPCRLSRQ